MKHKVLMKDGSYEDLEVDDWDNAPNLAWKKFDQKWSTILK